MRRISNCATAPVAPTGRMPSPAACRSRCPARGWASPWRWRSAAMPPSTLPPPCTPTCVWTTSPASRSKACRAATTRTAPTAAPCTASTITQSPSTAKPTASTATSSPRSPWSTANIASRSNTRASAMRSSGTPANASPPASPTSPRVSTRASSASKPARCCSRWCWRPANRGGAHNCWAEAGLLLQEQLSSSDGLRLPGLLVPEHGVDLCQEGAHAGDQGHLGAFAPASECLIALLQGRLGADRAPSGHVQHAPDASAPTPDAAQSALAAAVGVVGGDADQGRDLSAFDLPQFGQERDQGGGSDRPDARDGTQLGRSLAVGLGDGLGDGLVQQDDFRLQPAQLALQAGHDQRLALHLLQPAPLVVTLLYHLAAALDQGLQPLLLRGFLRRGRRIGHL